MIQQADETKTQTVTPITFWHELSSFIKSKGTQVLHAFARKRFADANLRGWTFAITSRYRQKYALNWLHCCQNITF